MKKEQYLILIFLSIFLFSCSSNENKKNLSAVSDETNTYDSIPIIPFDDPIIDCDYTFEEAVEGTEAPLSLIQELELLTVQYYSTDGKLHQGQILCNRKITKDIITIFELMKDLKFPVAQAIPIVRYGWNDELSMQMNNTYSFCFRNISYSKHATGMAIDINPYFNPLRWKTEKRPNSPSGAVYNPEVPGTFYKNHPIVVKFQRLGYLWGNSFSRYYDDHHFEKK